MSARRGLVIVASGLLVGVLLCVQSYIFVVVVVLVFLVSPENAGFLRDVILKVLLEAFFRELADALEEENSRIYIKDSVVVIINR